MIWEEKEHNRNAEWINKMKNELKGIEEGPKVDIHLDSLRITLKKIAYWKTPGYDGIYGFWFKKIHVYP